MNDGGNELLDPIERVSEILFGLIMAVSVVGSLSIATAGQDAGRAVMTAALGCNLAWGLVDAVMHLVRTLTERTRNLTLGRQLVDADAETARRLIMAQLPEHVAIITGRTELDGMRRRLLALAMPQRIGLNARDYLAAVGIFVLVVAGTFPVVLPFLLTDDTSMAMQFSRAVTLAMLFGLGLVLGRHAGHARPAATGLVMLLLGVVLIAAVMALGG
jgi:VIT1/CCC1 family predicted Fe2+/Mn2+ transporter